MKRIHTEYSPRYGHHERASMAVRVKRLVRRLLRPARLMWLARQQRNVDEHFADLAASREWLSRAMTAAREEQVRIQERYEAVERGLV